MCIVTGRKMVGIKEKVCEVNVLQLRNEKESRKSYDVHMWLFLVWVH